MLPYNLLPSGMLDQLRTTSRQFMQNVIEVYHPTYSFTRYGEQVIVSGTPTTYSGYIGAINGKDQEFIIRSGNYIITNQGTELTQYATILLPFGSDIQSTAIFRANSIDWIIRWKNAATMNGVQLYEKFIVQQKDAVLQKE